MTPRCGSSSRDDPPDARLRVSVPQSSDVAPYPPEPDVLRFAAFLLVFLRPATVQAKTLSIGRPIFSRCFSRSPCDCRDCRGRRVRRGHLVFRAELVLDHDSSAFGERERQQRIDVPLRLLPAQGAANLGRSTSGLHPVRLDTRRTSLHPARPPTKYFLAFVFFAGTGHVSHGGSRKVSPRRCGPCRSRSSPIELADRSATVEELPAWVVLGLMAIASVTAFSWWRHAPYILDLVQYCFARLDPIAGGALVALWTQKGGTWRWRRGCGGS